MASGQQGSVSDGAPARAYDECLGCGYDLTGLAPGTVCPECEFPVDRSRKRSKLLRGAELGWLVDMRRGLGKVSSAMWVLLSLFVAMLVWVMGVGLFTLASKDVAVLHRFAGVLAMLFVAVGLPAAAVLHVWGCILLGRETHGGYAASAWSRAAVRWGGMVLIVCAGYTFSGGHRLMALPGWGFLVMNAVCLAVAGAFLLGLARVLETLEARTAAWTPDLRHRHGGLRRNLYGAIIIGGIFIVARPTTESALGLLGLAYMLMYSPVRRVLRAVETELTIAREVGGTDAGVLGEEAAAGSLATSGGP